MMRILIFIPAIALLAASAVAAEEAKLENEQDKAIYALGAMLPVSALRGVDLDERETEILVRGLTDQLLGRPLEIDPAAEMVGIGQFVKERLEEGVAKEKAVSAKFLADTAAEPGAVTTDSGIVYRDTKVGGGRAPGPEDTVKVHYHGTRRDGSVFDSSRERGEPAVFALQQVIPCWTEALQRMKTGGTALVACPSSLAYGDNGTARIKPGAALRFDIELIEVQESALDQPTDDASGSGDES